MATYVVTWSMPIEADSAEDAARKALAIHRDPESIATCFTVQKGDEDWEIDLLEEDADHG